jgi:uncharacterized membrane protein YphA (DoxX/SURF4 family)
MNRLVTLSRALLGLVFVVFGFDGVLHFIPLPAMPAAAAEVIAVLKGYGLFYVVKALEVSAGLLLLSGRQVPLALAVLVPITFNIVWFDAALDRASLPVGLGLVALQGVLLWSRRPLLQPLLHARA